MVFVHVPLVRSQKEVLKEAQRAKNKILETNGPSDFLSCYILYADVLLEVSIYVYNVLM